MRHKQIISGSRAQRRGCASKGFTLVELLMVAGVIIILAGLGGMAVAVVQKRMMASNTRMLLTSLIGLAEEYRAKLGYFPQLPANMHPAPPPAISGPGDFDPGCEESRTGLSSTAIFLGQIQQIAEIAPQTQRFKEYFIDADNNGNIEHVADAYGTPLEYRPYNSNPNDQTVDTSLGNVSVQSETVSTKTKGERSSKLLRIYNGPFLVSAGPDKAWGDFSANVILGGDEKARDNMYSFDSK